MTLSPTLLSKRPPNVQKVFGDVPTPLVNGKALYDTAKKEHFIVGAFNVRSTLSIPGIALAAKETDSVVAYEIAKSETTYTGLPPEKFSRAIVEGVTRVGCEVPYAIHADHTTVKNTTEEAIESARDIIRRSIASGYTSVSIDASHNENEDNLRITRDLARQVVEAGLGLEVEIGEIGGERGFSTPEEGKWFIENLVKDGIHPDLLAINNGSVHGNYGPGFGEGIQLDTTKAIYEAISPWNVGIAQHGISGTPLDKIARFADYGIFKGNVATLFQNIVFGLKMEDNGNAVYDEDGDYIKLEDEGIPMDLWREVTAWMKETGNTGGNLKRANLPFKEKMESIDRKYKERINKRTYEWAKNLFQALRSVNSGRKVLEYIG
ncbi:MAG: class II fructose-bisphosphate aldolase [Planctomycetota bacterium]|nr:MAG: class II fructose-bisphosphate aldolase [Planctomycetota bacterium]